MPGANVRVLVRLKGATWSCRLAEKSWACVVDLEKYRSTASDFHRPIPLTSSLGIPAATAVLAAPRQKEWPEYVVGSMPALRRALVSLSVNHFLLKGPHDVEKSGSVVDLG